jgi:RNA polymerase sigma factor (sigma-70 family)
MSLRVVETEPLASQGSEAAAARRRKLAARRPDDEQLASRVADGNELAFRALYERYHQLLYRYCRSLLHNDADAQDAVQSAFTSALVALQRRRRDAPLRPWLFRIAHNEAMSLVRRRRDGDQQLSESLLPPVESAADQAGQRARLALLVADLSHLPDRQRGALLMRELSGLSHEEIALALGTSSAAAKQAIFEARAALSDFAEGRAAPCEDIRRRLSERDGRVLRNRRLRSHLRDCSSCDAFAAAIGQRRSDLRAVAPALPVVASVGLLARIGRAEGNQGLSTLSAGGVTAAAAGKLGGVALLSKSLGAIAAAVTAAAGVAGLSSSLHRKHPVSPALPRAYAPAAVPPTARAAARVTGPAAAHATPQGAQGNANRSDSRWRAAGHASPTRPAARTPNTSATADPSAHRVPTTRRFGSAAGKRPVTLKPTLTPTPTSPTQSNVKQTPTPGPGPAPTSQSVPSSGETIAAPDRGDTTPGNSGAAPGAGETTPGNSGAAPSPGETTPGESGAAPVHRTTAPGSSGASRGNSSVAPGRTGAAPGRGGTSPAQGATPPGQGATPPGQTITAPEQPSRPARQSTAAPGSAAPPGHGSIPPGQTHK